MKDFDDENCHSALSNFADWQYFWPKDIQLTAECPC